MQCTKEKDENLLLFSTSRSQQINENNMNKKKIYQWHITKDVYGEIHYSNPSIYISYIRNINEDTKLILTRTISHKYAQLSQLTS